MWKKHAKSVVMSVMGDCKSGEIRIKIVMPNGKNYSDILIDESGNLNWRKSFTISETENQDKTGDWKFQISSTKQQDFLRSHSDILVFIPDKRGSGMGNQSPFLFCIKSEL